ncbi:hypothetical protein [Legionella sp. km772]|uniref:hypothetical protein n=1 Tax=Legionella sp. km772 TaxID=2498111 RepID=UPI000F8C5A8D|nr:hypothetical protein [Legionella sp. km772]RUR10247.1 hypothetical protein ELY15_08365 [Legionella sp. km772]
MQLNAKLLASLKLDFFSSQEEIKAAFQQKLEETIDWIEKDELISYRDLVINELEDKPDLIGLIKTAADLNAVLNHYPLEVSLRTLGSLHNKEYTMSFWNELHHKLKVASPSLLAAGFFVRNPNLLFSFLTGTFIKAAYDTAVKPEQSLLEKMIFDNNGLRGVLDGLPPKATRCALMFLRTLPNFDEHALQTIHPEEAATKLLPKPLKQYANTVISYAYDLPKSQKQYLADARILNKLQNKFASSSFLQKLLFLLEYSDCIETTEGNPAALFNDFQQLHKEVYSLITKTYYELVKQYNQGSISLTAKATHYKLITSEGNDVFKEYLKSELPASLNVQLCNALIEFPEEKTPDSVFLLAEYLDTGVMKKIQGENKRLLLQDVSEQSAQEDELEGLKANLKDIKTDVLKVLDELVNHIHTRKPIPWMHPT